MWALQPYADRIASYLKERHPTVPVVYFANGGSGYLHRQKDMHVDGLSIDWKLSMDRAREVCTTPMHSFYSTCNFLFATFSAAKSNENLVFSASR